MDRQYSNTPAMQIDPKKSYTARFDTSKGQFDTRII